MHVFDTSAFRPCRLSDTDRGGDELVDPVTLLRLRAYANRLVNNRIAIAITLK
jgi:hypothetical protein